MSSPKIARCIEGVMKPETAEYIASRPAKGMDLMKFVRFLEEHDPEYLVEFERKCADALNKVTTP